MTPLVPLVSEEELKAEYLARPQPYMYRSQAEYHERMAQFRPYQTALILRMLITGHTQERAAKAIGYGRRHVNRLLKDYADRYNVNGICQIAVHAFASKYLDVYRLPPRPPALMTAPVSHE